MAIYEKKSGIGGKWANKAELKEKGVSGAKIVSETNPYPSTFKDQKGNPQTQDVCKIQFDGEPEAVNASLNGATIDALVDAFGKDSKDWQGHELAVEIDKLPGKKFPLYLIPEGYERIEDDNGYSVIVKKGETPEVKAVPVVEEEEGKIATEDLPF